MKPLLILILSLSSVIIACNNSEQGFTSKAKAKELKFSLKNETKVPIKEIKIRLPDTTLYFSNLDSMSRTNWVNVKSSYRYAPMEFKDSKDSTYTLRIIDYSGEKLYDSGCMTFIFQTRDTKDKHIGKNNSIYENTYWGYSLECDSVNKK